MRYKTLLFDVDDTLLDFKDAENQALHALFQEVAIELTPEIEQSYQTINQQRWREYELGNMTSEEVVNGRFGLLFAQLGKAVDSPEMERHYRYYLNQGHKLLGNSLAVVQRLASEAALYIVTNGVAATQMQRLSDAKLTPYFQKLFISETVGFQKPRREFFDYVFAQIPDFQPAQTVIIGDSLTSDIQGGANAGIDTIWLNLQPTSSAAAIQPTYQIQRLEELYPILEK